MSVRYWILSVKSSKQFLRALFSFYASSFVDRVLHHFFKLLLWVLKGIWKKQHRVTTCITIFIPLFKWAKGQLGQVIQQNSFFSNDTRWMLYLNRRISCSLSSFPQFILLFLILTVFLQVWVSLCFQVFVFLPS